MALPWQPGLSGLRKAHAGGVRDKRAQQSCDIDAFYAKAEPQAHRWDYVVERPASGARTGAGVEVHPASTGEVASMIAKKLWAEARLHADEPGLHMTKWHWLATGGIHIPATTPQARALAKAGIARPQKVILEL